VWLFEGRLLYSFIFIPLVDGNGNNAVSVFGRDEVAQRVRDYPLQTNLTPLS
jgi:hypothetical protein